MVHLPVMLNEVLGFLTPGECKVILDGTVGCGGHSIELLRRSKRVRIIGLDKDEKAIAFARKRLEKYSSRISLYKTSFDNLDAVLEHDPGKGGLDGAFLDLGLSSLQLDDNGRGFSYLVDGPLDMRMGSGGRMARDIIAESTVEELAGILRSYGEVPNSRRIAAKIKAAQQENRMNSTKDLRSAVDAAAGSRSSFSLMSKVFQSLRISVNDELGCLRRFLDSVLKYLNPRARLVIISYHSLEDRMVKNFFSRESRGCICPPEIPACVCRHEPVLTVLTKRVMRPTREEVSANPRARSARLRAAEML